MIPPYPVYCHAPRCGRDAQYKIAARWSDGVTHEFKTYALACPSCVPALFEQSLTKQRVCQLTLGETLEPPGVYELIRGLRDQQLVRRKDLETIGPTGSPRTTLHGLPHA